MAEPNTNRRALRERRLRELPVQMRYLIWEARRLCPPLMRDELASWTPNALALVDQLTKLIEGHLTKAVAKPARSR